MKQPFMEGIIDDSLKASLDVDTEEIKKRWEAIDNDPDGGGILAKAEVLNDEGLGKAASSLKSYERTLKTQKVSTRSIIARARNSVLQFPVYASMSLRVNEAHTISKLFERVYASFVQAVISQNPIMNEEEANDLLFLKKFHTNLSECADIFFNEYYQPIDEFDRMLKESAYNVIEISPTMTMYFCCSAKHPLINLENSRLCNEPLSGFYYLSEGKEDKTIDSQTKEIEDRGVSNDELRQIAADKGGLSQAEQQLAGMSNKDIEDKYGGAGTQLAKDKITEKNNLNDKIDDEAQKIKDEIKANPSNDYGILWKNGRLVRQNLKVKNVDQRGRSHDGPDAPKMLRDADIKKINGMLPYTIECTFRIKDKSGTLQRDVHYVIGVRTVLHPIHMNDIADDLQNLVTGEIRSLQKVRYKTGEISWWEYMFNVKQIKRDALKNLNANKRWLNTLKRSKDFQKTHGSLLRTPAEIISGRKGIPIPNGTMIITQTDVDLLKSQTGIDLNGLGNVRRLCRSIMLIAFGIVDSAAGTLKVFFPDNDTNWDVQSLSQVDAELAKTDNSKLMSELNRMVNRA